MGELRELGVSRNTCPPAIRGLSTLLVLSLTSNDIGELGCSDFLKLTRLMQLFLSNNRISKLRGCVFRDLNNLRLLDIEGNLIFSLSDTFTGGLQNLRILLMRGNDLKQLEKGYFESVPMLLSLDLASLSSYYVENGTFEELHRLESLIITAFTLTKDMFRGLRNLKSLTIYFPASLNNMTNQLFDGPAFLNLPSLRELTIKHNNRYTLVISPDVLRGLRYLQRLETEKFFTTMPHPDTFTFTPLLTSLKLISSNVSLPTPELFGPIPNLQALDLSKNKLWSLDFLISVNLSALSWLKLRENELTVINETVFQYLSALRYLDLFENPFTCNCSNIGFIQWVKHNNQVQVVNAYQYECFCPPSKQGTKLLDFDIQSCWMDISFICFISSTCIILVYALHLFLAFLYDNRKRKKGILCQYDAFVSYNVRDEEWVCREMLPVLEGEQGWRLCLHHRDFQPGKPIIENITDAIYSSRKTIGVISRSYLQSEWCSREIQMASFRLFDEKKDVLILLFLEEIPAQQLSPYYRMRKLVKKRTYLSWPRAGQHPGVFWQNVRRALETGNAPNETTNLLTCSLPPD
uniref:TIR domain-containing protein n=1 Tax=Oreochromis niloticus TaxID=8128 RepID=I3J7X5_ORENI